MKNDLQINQELCFNQEHKNQKFFDFWSRYYDKGIAGRLLLDIIKKTINAIEIKNGSRILDAGTGTGNLLYLLKQQNKSKNFRLYGIDISEKMLKIAEKKIKANFIKMSVLQLDKKFKKEFFDYVFVIDAFHHFPQQKKVMHIFYKILKNNSRLVVTELDFGYIFNYIFHLIEPGNEWLYTKNDIKELFKENNFSVEKQKRLGLFSVMTVGVKITKNEGDNEL